MHPAGHLIVISQSEKILAITNAAGVDLEPIWATLLAKALEGKNVKELLSNVGSGGGAPAVGAPVAAGGAAAAAAEAPAEEKKEEEKEESDDDMVCIPFDPFRKCSSSVIHRVLVSSTNCGTYCLFSFSLPSPCILHQMPCISPFHYTHLK